MDVLSNRLVHWTFGQGKWRYDEIYREISIVILNHSIPTKPSYINSHEYIF